MFGHDQGRRLQAAPRCEEPTDQPGRGGERWVGDDVERPARRTEVGGVGLDHPDARTESVAQLLGPAWMQLDGDHPMAGAKQPPGDDAAAGADVEHRLPGPEACETDQAVSPSAVEFVEAPPPL